MNKFVLFFKFFLFAEQSETEVAIFPPIMKVVHFCNYIVQRHLWTKVHYTCKAPSVCLP